ncbi:Hypothetical protein MVR_LOCUS41 [uncultured virus]|nr:Hypothetical protein MVR_LOCUS41 [uncultured virus]
MYSVTFTAYGMPTQPMPPMMGMHTQPMMPGQPMMSMMPMMGMMPAQSATGMMSNQPMQSAMGMPMMPMPNQSMQNTMSMMQQMMIMRTMMPMGMSPMGYPQGLPAFGLPAHQHPHTMPASSMPGMFGMPQMAEPMNPFSFAQGMSSPHSQQQQTPWAQQAPRSAPQHTHSFTGFEELADALTRAAGMGPSHGPTPNSNDGIRVTPGTGPSRGSRPHHAFKRHGGRPNQGIPAPDRVSLTKIESLQELIQMLTQTDDSTGPTSPFEIECGSIEEAIRIILDDAQQQTQSAATPKTAAKPTRIPKSNTETMCDGMRHRVNVSEVMANPELIDSYPASLRPFLHKLFDSVNSREETKTENTGDSRASKPGCTNYGGLKGLRDEDSDCDEESDEEGKTFSIRIPIPTHRWQSVTPTPTPTTKPESTPEPVSTPTECDLTPPDIGDMDYHDVMAAETVIPGFTDCIGQASGPVPDMDGTETKTETPETEDYESDDGVVITDESTD